MRWGNWDVVTQGSRFMASEVPSGITTFANPVPSGQTLPASFFLNSKPDFWAASKPWPGIESRRHRWEHSQRGRSRVHGSGAGLLCVGHGRTVGRQRRGVVVQRGHLLFARAQRCPVGSHEPEDCSLSTRVVPSSSCERAASGGARTSFTDS